MHTWLALRDLYAFTQKHAHVWHHLQLTGITYPAAANQLQKQKRLESCLNQYTAAFTQYKWLMNCI